MTVRLEPIGITPTPALLALVTPCSADNPLRGLLFECLPLKWEEERPIARSMILLHAPSCALVNPLGYSGTQSAATYLISHM